jgi:hypothetical protein
MNIQGHDMSYDGNVIPLGLPASFNCNLPQATPEGNPDDQINLTKEDHIKISLSRTNNKQRA